MSFQICGLPTDTVRKLQNGGRDVYGNEPERRVSSGSGTPCRHCLEPIATGEDFLVVAYRLRLCGNSLC
jgi:hypothetical protein